jgi:hypothetical protein
MDKKKDCGCGFGKKKKSIPVDKKLYSKILNSVKSKVKVWPSAYASGQVVRRYKLEGGKYSFGNSTSLNPQIKKCLSLIYGDKVLTRFGKKVSAKPPSGLTRWFKEKWVNVCVPKKNGKYQSCAKSSKKYPYCRPSVRVNSGTPKTIKELSKTKLKQMCILKKNKKRVNLKN